MAVKYTIGLDYGTLSARALLVDVRNGSEIAESVYKYPNSVISNELQGEKLGDNFALQNPRDYLDAFYFLIKDILGKSNVQPCDIIGIGIDFTSCTILPVYSDGTPLCFDEKFISRPHAYVKLWKHHGAQKQADEIYEKAVETKQPWLKRYGGKVSCEWMFPKLLEIIECDPEIYNTADYFIEAGDWLVWQVTDKQIRSTCMAGYKACWHKNDGYPDEKFLQNVNESFTNIIRTKLNGKVMPAGTPAGNVSREISVKTGLSESTVVSPAIIDAHSAVPAVKVNRPGQMLMILGTSACYMLLGEKEIPVDGICGYVEDGIVPGYLGYEAGQSCYGDHFQYYIDRLMPYEYKTEAEKLGKSDIEYISEKAAKLKPGESGIIALDWWNGNRSILVDTELSGMILGLNLSTKPEEIFRAIVEATAFGTRKIIENFEANGIAVNELYACGGIAEKNPLILQIIADVTGKEIRISGTSQASALGAAIFAAAAAGNKNGGYDTIAEASEAMGKVDENKIYLPGSSSHSVYNELYSEYCILHDYFGRGENNVMKRLINMRKNTENK